MERAKGDVTLEIADAVGTICFRRADKLNAFTSFMHGRLRTVLEEARYLAIRGEMRALLLTGEGRAFCTGQDLSERRRQPGAPSHDLGASVRQNYNPVVRLISEMPVPVIAAVNGAAAGAGLGLAASCDIVLAARSATFIASFARVGLVADTGLSWLLPRIVGAGRARAMLLIPEPVSGSDAVAIGLAHQLVEDAELMPTALGLATRMANGPTAAFALSKHLQNGSWSRSLPDQLEAEAEAMQAAGSTADYGEGVEAFLARRPPRFTGR